MANIAFRILVGIVTFYLAVLAIVLLFQSWFLFPAPQDHRDPAPGFEAITLTTYDGLELTGHWRKPDEGKPTIVWFHGNGSSLAGSANETRLLATQGYGLLLAPYRGYGGNPGDPSEQGFYRDGRSAMEFLTGQGVAPDQTVVAGNSIGSGTAVQMTSEFSPAALILVAPFTSLTDVASEKLPIFPVRLLLRHRFDNASKITSLELPMLVLHGNVDAVVPFAHGQNLAARNARAQFIGFEGAGHDLSFWQEAQQAQLNWLERLGL